MRLYLCLTVFHLLITLSSQAQFGVLINSRAMLEEALDSNEMYYAHECAALIGMSLDSLDYITDEEYPAFSECHNDYNTLVGIRRNFSRSGTMLGEDTTPMAYMKYFPGTVPLENPGVMFFLLKSDDRIKLHLQYYF